MNTGVSPTCFLLLLLLLGGVTTPANAHAILVKSAPSADSVVLEPAIPISLTFNSRIDGARSRLTLIGPDSAEHTIELAPQKTPNTLTGRIQDLKPGTYRLRWQVLALDGHITRGEIPFQVRLGN